MKLATTQETAREALTIRAALAELFAEILRHDARAVGVARLAGMVARSEVVDVIRRRVLLQLDLAAVNRPEAQLLLLLARRSGFLDVFLSREIGRFLLGELINLPFKKQNKKKQTFLLLLLFCCLMNSSPTNLLARFTEKRLSDGAIVVEQNLMDDSE